MGCKVTIKLGSPFNSTGILRNVTEIHYRYPFALWLSVAFESDIHGTGVTYPLEQVGGFETELETEKAETF